MANRKFLLLTIAEMKTTLRRQRSSILCAISYLPAITGNNFDRRREEKRKVAELTRRGFDLPAPSNTHVYNGVVALEHWRSFQVSTVPATYRRLGGNVV